MQKAKKKVARKPRSHVVSGMPDSSAVPTTGDDIEAAYNFVKKQRRRTPPK
jgi:hypothetical protein